MDLTKTFNVQYAKDTPYLEWVELNKKVLDRFKLKPSATYEILTGKKAPKPEPKKEEPKKGK